MKSGLQVAVYLAGLLACGLAFAGSDRPTLRASTKDAGILVEASDDVGLDSLSIAWTEGDLTYQTGLAAGRTFKRFLPLREMFPAAERNAEVRLTVTVRNTRGAAASTSITVRPGAPQKGN